MLKITSKLREWIYNTTGIFLPPRIVNMILFFVLLLVILGVVITQRLSYTAGSSVDEEITNDAIEEMIRNERIQ